jgi:hypothetical protein
MPGDCPGGKSGCFAGGRNGRVVDKPARNPRQRVRLYRETPLGQLLWYTPVLASQTHRANREHLIDENIPSIHTRIELRSKEVIALHCLHPRPSHPDQGQDATGRDAELLIVGRAVKAAGKPALVAGDLNDVAWSSTIFFRGAIVSNPSLKGWVTLKCRSASRLASRSEVMKVAGVFSPRSKLHW